jgi:hypothetical protein
MAEHRVSMLGVPLRRYEDPARSSDPRVRELVTALATLEPAPAPRAHFRAELRAQLVAVAPRLIAEGEATPQPTVPRRPEVAAAGERQGVKQGLLAGLRLGRPLAAVGCTVVILAMLLGGAVLASRSALPGSTLYNIKRASENAQLDATSGAEAKARFTLHLASTRFDEVSALLPKSDGAPSSRVTSLAISTLNSANSDLVTASQSLGAQAIRNSSAKPLDVLSTWAPSGLSQLTTIINRLPAGDLRDHAMASFTLLTSAFTRAKVLEAEAGCSCLHSAPSDQLGPIPCPVCVSSSQPGAPIVPGSSTPPATTSPTSGASPGATSSGAAGSSGSYSATHSSSSGAPPSPESSGSSPGIPGLSLPSLPVTVPTTLPTVPLGPVGIGSCGLSISLSPINLHLGSCAPKHS